MPVWVIESLKQGGLFAVAVICLTFTYAGVKIFYGMWKAERALGVDREKVQQENAAASAKANGDLANALNRLTDAVEGNTNEMQRNREEELRRRLEGSK